LKLLLFDIDGTLIHSGGAGKAAMERSFEKIYGLKDGFQGVQLMGRTDPSILLEALGQHHLEWKDAEVEKFREYYFWFLEEEIEKPRPDKALCPGVLPLLSALQQERDVELGLLTGNWKYSGLTKLRHFGIDGFFNFGAFADDSIRREELVPFAVDRYAKTSGMTSDKETVFVIGDTPLDIQCARPHGVKTVAVATGMHSLETLRSENPDYLFRSFTDTDEVLRIFRG
jgi:phosphoglycolate phosphatase-like HAD superfamily hydrolase